MLLPCCCCCCYAVAVIVEGRFAHFLSYPDFQFVFSIFRSGMSSVYGILPSVKVPHVGDISFFSVLFGKENEGILKKKCSLRKKCLFTAVACFFVYFFWNLCDHERWITGDESTTTTNYRPTLGARVDISYGQLQISLWASSWRQLHTRF